MIFNFCGAYARIWGYAESLGDPMRVLKAVFLSLLLVCQALAQTDDTIANYRETLAQTPDDGATHYALASYLMDSGGDLDEAM